MAVSTHSRPKAAGWAARFFALGDKVFQLTAARRRLATLFVPTLADKPVSTHSRPKAAGTNSVAVKSPPIVSTHSRPKAAGLI